MEEKAVLRKRIRRRLGQLDRENIERKSLLISETLFQSGCWQEADTVLCYLSFEFEVETKWIIDRAFEEHKTIGVPRITGDHLIFYRLSDRRHSLAKNSWGIREPGRNLPEISLRQLGGAAGKILIIVPGLAFDRQKNRLGRGGGYYDRFLAGVGESGGGAIFTVALCFREQLVTSVPVSEHDLKADMLIVEKEIIL